MATLSRDKFLESKARTKNVTVYSNEKTVIDEQTGEILSSSKETVKKVSKEPDFIKLYYETMLAFNRIHDIPISFVLSLSKFLEW